MTAIPWLSILMGVSVLGALGVSFLKNDKLAKQATLGVSLLVLVLAVVMTVGFNPNGDRFQYAETYDWIPSFGVHYAVAVDGVALVLILLSAVLVPIVVLASWHDAEQGKRSVRTYFALLLVLEAMMIGVFAATDVFLFYVFFEAMLIPMYFMIGVVRRRRSGPTRRCKFLLYSLFGGLLMLVAVIALVQRGRQEQLPVPRPHRRGHRPDDAEVALPGLLHRVRHQGPALAGAHLAARRRRAGSGRRRGAARGRARQGRHLRHAARSAWSCSPTRPSGRPRSSSRCR